jgi:hypothetical protein
MIRLGQNWLRYVSFRMNFNSIWLTASRLSRIGTTAIVVSYLSLVLAPLHPDIPSAA